MSHEPYRYMLVAKLHSYLGKHEDAVRVLSDGVERHPDSPHLYRHRGHFLISLRRSTEAINDFEKAVALLDDMEDEIEFYQAELVPEMERLLLGAPSSPVLEKPTPITDETLDRLRDVYKGTLKSSTWYHYALAYYLTGDFDAAVERYYTTLSHCVDDDMRVATLDWLYMSLRRAGRSEAAQNLLDGIDTSMHINEPSYHHRMRLYKGELSPESLLRSDTNDRRAVATLGYGVGNWHYYNGNVQRAAEVFRQVLDLGQTAAFGHLAAERDLAHLT